MFVWHNAGAHLRGWHSASGDVPLAAAQAYRTIEFGRLLAWRSITFSKTESGVTFDVVGEIEQIETIAAGPSVKARKFLWKIYGRGQWRKRKGIGTVRLPNGNLRRVDLHWYEAHGIGKRDLKIKKYLDKS